MILNIQLYWDRGVDKMQFTSVNSDGQDETVLRFKCTEAQAEDRFAELQEMIMDWAKSR